MKNELELVDRNHHRSPNHHRLPRAAASELAGGFFSYRTGMSQVRFAVLQDLRANQEKLFSEKEKKATYSERRLEPRDSNRTNRAKSSPRVVQARRASGRSQEALRCCCRLRCFPVLLLLLPQVSRS